MAIGRQAGPVHRILIQRCAFSIPDTYIATTKTSQQAWTIQPDVGVAIICGEAGGRPTTASATQPLVPPVGGRAPPVGGQDCAESPNPDYSRPGDSTYVVTHVYVLLIFKRCCGRSARKAPLPSLADGVVVWSGGREQGGGTFGGQLVEVSPRPVAGEAIHFQAVFEFSHALLTFAGLVPPVVGNRGGSDSLSLVGIWESGYRKGAAMKGSYRKQDRRSS